MKKITSILFILFTIKGFSQTFQERSPWMKNLKNTQAKSNITLKDISEQAKNYFKNIDVNKKGSGIKPYERWKYHWSYYTNKEGVIRPAEELWTAWRKKRSIESKAKSDNSNWIPIGPFKSSNTYSANNLQSSGQGRVNVVAVDPNNPNTYYVGAPAGGIWKSIDAGIHWTPLTDYLPQIGVSGIAIDPNDSNTIYIATGDDDADDSYSVGVWKSTDGGTTWSPTGAMQGNPRSMNEIFISPNDSNFIIVATNTGVQKSVDGGISWNVKLAENIGDLRMKPSDPNTWYAVSNSKFYKSSDAGETFKEINVFGLSNSRRLAIAVTPANPDYIYMVSADANSAFNGIFRSKSSGVFFAKTTENDDIFRSSQAWFDLAITASSTNPDIVYVGVLDIWKSTDAGNDFRKITDWRNPNESSYTHADIHFMKFIDGKFFAGTDGGVYVSTDEGSNFTDLSENLSISQFYRISVSPQNSSVIAGGLQDNGGFSYNEQKWKNYHGGDGMEGLVDPTNENVHYGFIQYGNPLNKTENNGASVSLEIDAPSEETGENDDGGEWVTPLASNSKGELYAGYKQLYKLVNNSWTKISNDQFFGGDDIDHIEIDPNNNNNIYVAQSNGLYRSIDAGITFSKIDFNHEQINYIEISNNDPNTAWVVVNDGVYKTSDILSDSPVFTNITYNLPSETKITLKHHARSGKNTIYLGTALGVYFLNDDEPSTWKVYSNKLPNVAVRDIEINEEDSKLFAGTFGRGVFVTEIPKILPPVDVRLMSINSLSLDRIVCGTEISPKVTVKNQGKNSINSITFDYVIDEGVSNTYAWNGTLNSEQTLEIDIPSISTTLGRHTINFEATTPNDTYNSNNNAKTSFDINPRSSKPTTINSFENTDDALLVETISTSNLDLWEIAIPNKTLLKSTGTGTKAYITGASGNYPDKTTSYLYTNCYNLSIIQNPVMAFKMAFDLEKEWDYMVVEYSTDYGGNWTILGTATDANWYNSAATTDDTNRSSLPGKQWTGLGEEDNPLGGTNATLHSYNYDLSSFSSESNIIFRFAFKSDDLTNEEGVVIDDFVINGTLSIEDDIFQNSFSIYPNPSQEVFNLNWSGGEKTSISIYNNIGKLVFEKKNIKNTNTYQISLKNYSKGLYFVKINADDRQATKKIILK